MRLTIIQPAVGRRAGDRWYLRSWQMEPLAPAALAGLTPGGVDIRFYDDRIESIPYDEPTDLVAITVETYTAMRSYQIATEFRRRGVPVVMGGFHATLCTEEVAEFAEAVVVGEAEGQWQLLLDDFRHGSLQRVYSRPNRPSPSESRTDRTIFSGKRYLGIRLLETGRGCHLRCDFCAIQSFFHSTRETRPTDSILGEIAETREGTNLYFFVDDNITANLQMAKEFFRALIPLGIRWVSQASINAAHDEELLELMYRSGCQALLIGFESLDSRTLKQMNKGFNTMGGGYEVALANLRRHRIRLYATFVFGYDHDTPETFARTLDFAHQHRFYLAAFNHLIPFPGTPLYGHLHDADRLLFDAWWKNPRYRFNHVPFQPLGMTPEELQSSCLNARKKFYSRGSILRRFMNPVNRTNPFIARNFLPINWMMSREVRQRDLLPLGDSGWPGELIPARDGRLAPPGR